MERLMSCLVSCTGDHLCTILARVRAAAEWFHPAGAASGHRFNGLYGPFHAPLRLAQCQKFKTVADCGGDPLLSLLFMQVRSGLETYLAPAFCPGHFDPALAALLGALAPWPLLNFLPCLARRGAVLARQKINFQRSRNAKSLNANTTRQRQLWHQQLLP
jgi:hypothetical protein